MNNRPADYQQRMQALEPDASFLCEAPAGSGKTELLTQRFLGLLSHVERPEELLAITFTRKATAEMRDRIMDALVMAGREEPDDEYKKLTWQIAREALAANQAHGWDLLHNPNRLQVRTFDSLCSHLSRALPYQSGFGAPPETTDEPDALYRTAVYQLFEDLEQNNAWSAALGTVLRHVDNNFQSLESLMISMLRRRDHWLPLIGRDAVISEINTVLEAGLQHVCDDVVARLHELVPDDCRQELFELARFAAGNLSKSDTDSIICECLDIDRLPGSDEIGIRQWSGILELLITKTEGGWRKAVNKNTGFPVGGKNLEKEQFKRMKERMSALIQELKNINGLHEALQDLRFLPDIHYEPRQLEVLDALAEILPVLVARLTLVFSEKDPYDFSEDNATVDYTEVSIRARRALGGLDSPTDLALSLDYRIRHILVDEFQDVSSSQVKLLELLTAGWQPGDGHTLFCVGDAMQSIYGFRDADVGLFLHCGEHGLGDVPLTPISLNTNFRSGGQVVDWINRTFQPAFPLQNDISSGAVSFSPSVAYHPGAESHAVRVYGLEEEGYDQMEAEKVLAIIEQARSEIPDASIAVLVRTRNHAGHITPLLKQAGHSYQAIELEPLSGHIVIQDLMSLTHALLHPGDRIAWLSVLRAPWCGLLLNDMNEIANCNGDHRDSTIIEQLHACLDSKTSLSDDAKTRLERVMPVLDRALAERQRKPLREWIEGAWLGLGGPACVDDAADLKNAEMFFSLLESLDASGSLPELDSLHEAVDGLFAAPDPNGDERLQIMTMHKAKGLEFDVVIIPSLHKKPRASTGELIMWQDRLTAAGGRDLIMAPIPETGRDKDGIYQYLQYEQKKKETYESCRLLYVACTRARQQLHLFTNFNTPVKTSLINTIWESVAGEIELLQEEEGTGTDAVLTPAAKYLRRLPEAWQYPELSRRNLLEEFTSQPDDFNFDDETAEAEQPEGEDPTARYIGTLVHQVLQEIGRQGMDSWDSNSFEESLPFWTARLATLGVASAKMNEAAERVRHIVEKVLQDENFQWMFSASHTERHSEYPVTIALPRGHRNLVIDLLIQEEGGNTWIIDYKTGEPSKGETTQSFIDSRMELNRKTMQLYREAVTRLRYVDVRLALYFPEIQQWSEYKY